jgi:glycosyltransferase involved in cell wall biosynthesis
MEGNLLGERKRIRILSLTSLFPNNVNPVSCVFIKERIRHLAELHDLCVVAPVPYFPRINLRRRWYEYSLVKFRERIDGMEVYHPRYFITPRVGMFLYGLFYFISILNFMLKMSRKYPFDLLDAHYIYPDGLAAVLLAKVLRKPVVLSARGTDINLFSTYPITRRWILYALRNCDHIIAVSEALKSIMVQLGIDARKIDVVPNGVDADQFRPIPQDEARKMLELAQEATILLSVGSLRPLKGFQYLLDAVGKIRACQLDLDLKLYIIGCGEYWRKLQQQIAQLGLQSHVELVGQVSHGQLYKWYNAADLFCLASSREGWPNVIMESLACGLPVVATPVGGIPEILSSEKYGMLLPSAEESQLVDQLKVGILDALQKRWDREDLVAYASRNSWELVAQRIDDVFQLALYNWSRGVNSESLDQRQEADRQ